jgi:acetyl esterase/lipase
MKQAPLATPILLFLVGCTWHATAQQRPAGLPADAGFAADVAYVENGHERQKLDIAFSREARPRPLLVWIHGGAYMGGDKGENHAIWEDLMALGYAVATINYRLSSDARWPAQITDCKAAIRYLRARADEYHLDPGRIAVWGSSAGGHLAALVGTSGGEKSFDNGEHLDQSSAVSCVVDLFGPADFETMPQFTSPDSPEARLWGRPTSEALELARTASPLTHLSRDTPPILILHGDADGVVHVSQSRQFEAAMKKAGAPGELVVLPGVGHSHVEVWIQKRDLILGFFERHLRSNAPVHP